MLNTVSLLISLTAFLAVVWIIIPAPAYSLWLYSVAASEWSLWLGGFSIVAIGLSLYIPLFGNGGKLWIASFLTAFISLLISVYPLYSSYRVANREKVSLSFVSYFGGLTKTSAQQFLTVEFSRNEDIPLLLDVYRPADPIPKNGAAVIVVHGGGWNARERNDFPRWNEWLARNGYTVFDIDYRLAPQPNYLSATGDVKCAVKWVKKHAAEYGISGDRIALFGRSAGAHLALLAAYSSGDPRLNSNCIESGQNEDVRAVVSFYAPIDLLWAFDNKSNEYVIDGPGMLSDFLGGNPHSSNEIKERYILASPTGHVKKQTPPTLLVHGGRDQLVREENMYFLSKRLEENGVRHKTLFLPYAQHGFDYNFYGWGSQIVKPLILDLLHENTKARHVGPG